MKINQLEPNHFYAKTRCKKHLTTFASSSSNNKLAIEKFNEAKKYADAAILMDGKIDLNNKKLLEKLEGLQYGIKAFEGVNITQISLLYQALKFILLDRSCSNECEHCFVEALPKNKTPLNVLKTMSWEDFNTMADAFFTMDSRLGLKGDIRRWPVIPFFDSDSMEIILSDKTGKEYDMVDIADIFKTKMGAQTVFDTSGWNPISEKMQKRAEKYVSEMLEGFENNSPKFSNIHLSLNPFHKIYSKSIELMEKDPAEAKRLRSLYVERMANVFYTFTPLFERKELTFLNRAVDDKLDCNENYKVKAHRQLISEIRESLENKYRISGMEEDEISKNLALFDMRANNIQPDRLKVVGRMKNLFPEDAKERRYSENIVKKDVKNPLKMLSNDYWSLYIDVNGKVYLNDQFAVAPTDIHLNFENKEKEALKIGLKATKSLSTDAILKELHSPTMVLKTALKKMKFVLRHYLMKLSQGGASKLRQLIRM